MADNMQIKIESEVLSFVDITLIANANNTLIGIGSSQFDESQWQQMKAEIDRLLFKSRTLLSQHSAKEQS